MGRPWVDGWLERQEQLEWTPKIDTVLIQYGIVWDSMGQDWVHQRSRAWWVGTQGGGHSQIRWLSRQMTGKAEHPGCLSGACPGKLWTKAMKDGVDPKPTLEENDGEFWMCYKDFLRLRNWGFLGFWGTIWWGLEGRPWPWWFQMAVQIHAGQKETKRNFVHHCSIKSYPPLILNHVKLLPPITIQIQTF